MPPQAAACLAFENAKLGRGEGASVGHCCSGRPPIRQLIRYPYVPYPLPDGLPKSVSRDGLADRRPPALLAERQLIRSYP